MEYRRDDLEKLMIEAGEAGDWSTVVACRQLLGYSPMQFGQDGDSWPTEKEARDLVSFAFEEGVQ